MNVYLKIYSIFFLVVFFLLSHDNLNGQITISGVVVDEKTNEELIGAAVILKGTSIGTVTDPEGKFEISVQKPLPFTLVVSYLGYIPQEYLVKSSKKKLIIKLSSESYLLDDIEVKGSRLSEKQKESPLTIESMDIIAIKETPAVNFYDGLGLLKGVDLTAASIGFKIVNTRGFNSTRPVRSLQIIDGVDNQAPGLNFSLGNFLGASELDIQKVELIAGASTAMYGPNAFNGVIKMTTKSPFLHKGLTLMTKIGERNLFETNIRYAKVFKNKDNEDKIAIKLNMSFMRANDWEASNKNPTEQSVMGRENWGGYDAINIYGDENLTAGTNNFSGNYGQRNFPGLRTYHRTGYSESDLVDYNSRNIKLSGSFFYKLKSDVEAQYAYFFGTGTTVYQGDNRYSLKDIIFQQHKIELKKPDKFYIRAYTTRENAGKSYDAVFTALLLQEAAKSNASWSKDYNTYWIQYVRPKIITLPGFPPRQNPYDYDKADEVMNLYNDSLIKWHNEAREYADGIGNPFFFGQPYFEPGTERFDSVFNQITSISTLLEGGSKFKDRSSLSHIQGEYKFTPGFIDFLLGGNYRIYTPNSSGTIFCDTGNVKITNYEYGFYANLEKRFFNKKLILTTTTRLDKNENFNYLLSPAASAVFLYNENNTFRLSFSSAIRNPTLQDQYLYYNVGRAILIGNIGGVDSLVTVPSLINYYSKLNRDTLEYYNIPPVRPEKVKTIEIGYKGTLFNKIFIDVSYYYSVYKDFLGYKLGSALEFDPGSGIINHTQFYRVSANSPDMVTTQGFSIGINYYFKKIYSLNGNYSYNILDRHGSIDPIIPAFNTPTHKYNIGISGRDITLKIDFLNKLIKKIPVIRLNNCGFNINYKWIQGFLFEGSPQFTGNIPTYDKLDAQINYKISKINSTFKLGASNILNNRKFHTYGGPYIGRFIYFSILVELNKNTM